MYREYLKGKVPHREELGIYVVPNLPAVKLGKVLMKDTRVSSPSDVVAFYLDSGFFASHMMVFTGTHLYFPGGGFPYEDLKSVVREGARLQLTINHLGKMDQQQMEFGDEKAAQILEKVIDGLTYFDPEKENGAEPDYSNFESPELDWLKLRDEVMKTIDMLGERFSDGKLSLIQYESKKEELLSRL